MKLANSAWERRTSWNPPSHSGGNFLFPWKLKVPFSLAFSLIAAHHFPKSPPGNMSKRKARANNNKKAGGHKKSLCCVAHVYPWSFFPLLYLRAEAACFFATDLHERRMIFFMLCSTSRDMERERKQSCGERERGDPERGLGIKNPLWEREITLNTAQRTQSKSEQENWDWRDT